MEQSVAGAEAREGTTGSLAAAAACELAEKPSRDGGVWAVWAVWAAVTLLQPTHTSPAAIETRPKIAQRKCSELPAMPVDFSTLKSHCLLLLLLHLLSLASFL